MNILCDICGQPIEFEKVGMSPGSNDPACIVKPCCLPEDYHWTDDDSDALLKETLYYISDSMSDALICGDDENVKLISSAAKKLLKQVEDDKKR